jgi:hypothetical protein
LILRNITSSMIQFVASLATIFIICLFVSHVEDFWQRPLLLLSCLWSSLFVLLKTYIKDHSNLLSFLWVSSCHPCSRNLTKTHSCSSSCLCHPRLVLKLSLRGYRSPFYLSPELVLYYYLSFICHRFYFDMNLGGSSC